MLIQAFNQLQLILIRIYIYIYKILFSGQINLTCFIPIILQKKSCHFHYLDYKQQLKQKQNNNNNNIATRSIIKR